MIVSADSKTVRNNPTAAKAPFVPARPDGGWLKGYLEPSLLGAAPYKIDTPPVDIKLDQNESPWDWPEPIKRKIVERLMTKSWNRYPGAFTDELADQVAAYAGLEKGSVLLGPGSNYLVSLVLTVFSKGFLGCGAEKSAAKLVIARPSFPLYESHCRYEGIPYEPWCLDKDLEFDEAALPALPDGSMVVFASPNNPVGNYLARTRFEALLTKYPKVLWVADEAYCEYTNDPYTHLIAKHANLILIRTFSKTLGCAGVRIGYVAAHDDYLGYLKKLRLPYLLNHFSIAAAEVILSDPATKDYLDQTRRNALAERKKVYDALKPLGDRHGFQVKWSEANFLLLRWPEQADAMKAYQGLIDRKILVRNVSGGPALAGCLRATLGNEDENQMLVAAFRGMFPP